MKAHTYASWPGVVVALLVAVAVSASLGQENPDPAQRPVDIEVWRRKIHDVLRSKSRQWRQAQLRRICTTLSPHTRTSEGASCLATLEVVELAQWAMNDIAAAKRSVERRYQILSASLPPDELAETAYADAARYSMRGYEAAARELYSRVVKSSPTCPKAVVADYNIGIILRRERDFTAASQHFLNAARRYFAGHPERARQCHYLAGDCAWRANDNDRAVELFAEVIREYPGTPEADDATHMRRDVLQGERPGDAPTKPGAPQEPEGGTGNE